MRYEYFKVPELTLVTKGKKVKQHCVADMVRQCMDIDSNIVVINEGLGQYKSTKTFMSSILIGFNKAHYHVSARTVDKHRIMIFKK